MFQIENDDEVKINIVIYNRMITCRCGRIKDEDKEH